MSHNLSPVGCTWVMERWQRERGTSVVKTQIHLLCPWCVRVRVCVCEVWDQNEEAVAPFVDGTPDRERLKINVSSYHPWYSPLFIISACDHWPRTLLVISCWGGQQKSRRKGGGEFHVDLDALMKLVIKLGGREKINLFETWTIKQKKNILISCLEPPRFELGNFRQPNLRELSCHLAMTSPRADFWILTDFLWENVTQQKSEEVDLFDLYCIYPSDEKFKKGCVTGMPLHKNKYKNLQLMVLFCGL